MRTLALALALVALCLPTLTACSSSPKVPDAEQVLDERQKAELTTVLAGQAVDALAALVKQADILLPPEKVEAAATALVEVRGVLKEVRGWLAGNLPPPTKERLLLGIERAEWLAALVRATGLKVPEATDRAITLARVLVCGEDGEGCARPPG